MFFVVYFSSIKQHLVVPAIYVYRLGDVFQKFMNYSCNSNQRFLCYYPLNGYENNVGVEPNFDAEISETFENDKEFCFICKIVKYFNDYDDAVAYKNRIRRQEPALNNPNRLYELPIPLIEPVVDEMEQFIVEEQIDHNPTHANEQANERNENVVLENQAENQGLVIIDVQENVVAGEAIHQIAQGGDEVLENFGLVEDEIEVKQEPELLIMNDIDEAEFDRILQDGDEDLDLSNNLLNLSVENESSSTESELNDSDEVEFEQIDSFPKPMVCTEDILSKFEDDSISFDLPYAPKKNGDRIYSVLGHRIIMPKVMLDKIQAWATPPFKENRKYDAEMVRLLLVKVVGMANLAAGNVGDDVKTFIKAFLRARVGVEDSDRIGYLEDHIKATCARYSKDE